LFMFSADGFAVPHRSCPAGDVIAAIMQQEDPPQHATLNSRVCILRACSRLLV
jgi:hypothetical protein